MVKVVRRQVHKGCPTWASYPIGNPQLIAPDRLIGAEADSAVVVEKDCSTSKSSEAMLHAPLEITSSMPTAQSSLRRDPEKGWEGHSRRTIRSPSGSNSPNGGTERRRDPRVNVCQH